MRVSLYSYNYWCSWRPYLSFISTCTCPPFIISRKCFYISWKNVLTFFSLFRWWWQDQVAQVSFYYFSSDSFLLLRPPTPRKSVLKPPRSSCYVTRIRFVRCDVIKDRIYTSFSSNLHSSVTALFLLWSGSSLSWWRAASDCVAKPPLRVIAREDGEQACRNHAQGSFVLFCVAWKLLGWAKLTTSHYSLQATGSTVANRP